MKAAWLDYLRVLLPDFWIMSGDYTKKWDTFIENNIHKARLIDQHIIDINGVKVWACNYPYAFGCPHGNYGMVLDSNMRPSRVNILRLHRMMGQEITRRKEETLDELCKRK